MSSTLTKYIIGVTFLSLAGSSFAKSGWTESGFIAELEATGHGRFIIRGKLKGNPSGCKDEKAYYMDYSATGAKQVYALMLEAITTGKPVKLHVTGGCELNGMSNIDSARISAK